MRSRSTSHSYLVPAIDRALTVMEFLANSKRGFTVSEISRKLLLPKSSTHLILATLEERGYVQKNQQTNMYRYGLKLISLSRAALEGLELRDEAKPFLEALMKKTGLTVHMAVLERNEAVIIEKIESPALVRVATWMGRRMDVNCTGAGKVLIAFLSEEEFDEQIRNKSLAKHNHKTIVSLSRLKRELVQVRKEGYAVDDEEDEIGLRCIGAPIFDNGGSVIAAISVAGTVSHIRPDNIHRLAKLVKQTASEISSYLGYESEALP